MGDKRLHCMTREEAVSPLVPLPNGQERVFMPRAAIATLHAARALGSTVSAAILRIGRRVREATDSLQTTIALK